MITREQYLAEPCKATSIPYWKAKRMYSSRELIILHHDDFDEEKYRQYKDEPYFRLIHRFEDLFVPSLPEGFSLCDITLSDYANHINRCYNSICISESELHNYTVREVYSAGLWLSVKDNRSGDIAATGIAELDREIGEGVLEWIQVSENYRNRGLGSYLVSELLWRMRGSARFATVSGQCNNPTKPERLYRKCGFTGTDIRHILKK